MIQVYLPPVGKFDFVAILPGFTRKGRTSIKREKEKV
jgi:hypothetical protein